MRLRFEWKEKLKEKERELEEHIKVSIICSKQVKAIKAEIKKLEIEKGD